MSRRFQNPWKDLFDQQEQALIDNGCAEAIDIATIEELQFSLEALAREYGSLGFPDMVSRLKPGFQYLQSFHNAITSATQYDGRACLLWGTIQALCQVSIHSWIIQKGQA